MNAQQNLVKHLQLACRQAHILFSRLEQLQQEDLLEIYYFAKELQAALDIIVGPVQ